MTIYDNQKDQIEVVYSKVQEMVVEGKVQYRVQTPLITCTNKTHAEAIYNKINAFVSQLSKDMLDINE